MRFVLLAVFALGGLAVLIALGVWQVQRLEWKTEILDRIDARIDGDPQPLPAEPDEAHDEYLAVAVEGRIDGPEFHVLVSTPEYGASYRVIAPILTEGGRRVLVDQGVIPVGEKEEARPDGPVAVVGNLLWPDEVDGFTPAPEMERNIWFARDLPSMAEVADTESVLIVARERVSDAVRPKPIGTEDIPNNHLQYAITWFSMAAIWSGMTLLLLWRMAVARK